MQYMLRIMCNDSMSMRSCDTGMTVVVETPPSIRHEPNWNIFRAYNHHQLMGIHSTAISSQGSNDHPQSKDLWQHRGTFPGWMHEINTYRGDPRAGCFSKPYRKVFPADHETKIGDNCIADKIFEHCSEENCQQIGSNIETWDSYSLEV